MNVKITSKLKWSINTGDSPKLKHLPLLYREGDCRKGIEIVKVGQSSRSNNVQIILGLLLIPLTATHDNYCCLRCKACTSGLAFQHFPHFFGHEPFFLALLLHTIILQHLNVGRKISLLLLLKQTSSSVYFCSFNIFTVYCDLLQHNSTAEQAWHKLEDITE